MTPISRRSVMFAAGAAEKPKTDPLGDEIGALDPDSMSPRDAIEAVYRLMRVANERGQ